MAADSVTPPPAQQGESMTPVTAIPKGASSRARARTTCTVLRPLRSGRRSVWLRRCQWTPADSAYCGRLIAGIFWCLVSRVILPSRGR